METKLLKGDKVIIGVLKEDYKNNILNNYSRSWYSGQHIDAIQLSTTDFKVTDLEVYEAYKLRERKIGFGIGIYTICWVLIAFLCRVSVIGIGEKYAIILVFSYPLLIFILYQIIK